LETDGNKSPRLGLSWRKKAGEDESEERRVNSTASVKEVRAGEASESTPARTVSAKGRLGHWGSMRGGVPGQRQRPWRR
jgi:hypothetical protein